MNDILTTVLAPIVVAAVLANVGVLFQLNSRMSRLEAQMEIICEKLGLKKA